MPIITDTIRRVLYDSGDKPVTLEGAHEIKADEPITTAVTPIIEGAVSEYLDIKWQVRYIDTTARRERSKAGETGVQVVFPQVEGFLYPAGGMGNLIRAIDKLKHSYSTWADVPDEEKQDIMHNSSTLLSFNYPNSDHKMIELVHLHTGETFSAIYYVPGGRAQGFRGRVNYKAIKPSEYLIDKDRGKAIRIICTNYLGSIENELFLGVFKGRLRKYAEDMGSIKMSLDGGEWNSACDEMAAALQRLQTAGVIDIRHLPPNINSDATLRLTDTLVPTSILRTAGFQFRTTSDESVEMYYDTTKLSTSLDMMVLAPGLTDENILGFDIREGVLDARLSALQNFYQTQANKSVLSPLEIEQKGDFYIARKTNPIEEWKLQSADLDTILTDSEKVLNLLSEDNKNERTKPANYLEAAQKLLEDCRIIESLINDESKWKNEDKTRRYDYGKILELRKLGSTIFANLATVFQKVPPTQVEQLVEELKKYFPLERQNTNAGQIKQKLTYHFLDAALVYNPNGIDIMCRLAQLIISNGQELFEISEDGSNRRARVYLSNALNVIDKKLEPTPDNSREIHVLEKRKAEILDEYIPILERLSPKYATIKKELEARRKEREGLPYNEYDVLEQTCRDRRVEFTILSREIDNVRSETEVNPAFISRVLEYVKAGNQSPEGMVRSAMYLLKDYRILRYLGSGGLKQVFEVEHKHQSEKEKLAVKLYIPTQKGWDILGLRHQDVEKAVMSEYDVRTRPDQRTNENINYVIYAWVDELAKVPVTSEYLCKGSLGDVYKTLGSEPFKFPQAADFIRQIANGLIGLEEIGKIHGDIKPPNILVGLDGKLKLTDFGQSLKIKALSHISDLQNVGYPTTMAPNLLCSTRTPSSADDVWSTATIAYLMLTGQEAFPMGFEGTQGEWRIMPMAQRIQLYDRKVLDKIQELEQEGIDRMITNISITGRGSNMVKDLLMKSLVIDPEKRIDIHELYDRANRLYQKLTS